MKQLLNISILLVTLLFNSAVFAAPWFEYLEGSVHELPWVYCGDIIQKEDSGVTVVVTETFIGNALPGDTLEIPFWESGSLMVETVVEGEGYLLLPDTEGNLQIVGTPGNGYWLLKGYFDFNAFIVEPGALNREELFLLCCGETLNPRTVKMEVRFAGSSEFIEIVFRENHGVWITDSGFEPLDSLKLVQWGIILGGMDNYFFEPDVTVSLPAGEGSTLTLEGRINSFENGIYNCTVYPSGPIILDSRSMADFLVYQIEPEPPVIAISVYGAEPEEFMLADHPYFTSDDNGWLHLTGSRGMLDITSLYFNEYRERPLVGFDVPMTCMNPVYFSFESLPEGPSGNLATDIIDALAKGTVTGSLGPDVNTDEARFALSLVSAE